MMKTTLLLPILAMGFCGLSMVAAQEGKPVELRIHPSAIVLDHPKDVQRLVVTAEFADGTTRDLTDQATLTVLSPSLATIRGMELVPGRPGEGRLRATALGLNAEASLSVKDLVVPEVSFDRDLVPALTKAGCNAGGCHGAALGKNGFQLSLFGFDPARDHERLSREMRGRRIDTVTPEQSLFLLKATGRIPHEGGPRWTTEDRGYQMALRWVEAGAPFGNEDHAKATGLVIHPQSSTFDQSGATQRLLVLSSDASAGDRDVTDWAILSSSDENIVKVKPDGTMVAGEPGEAYVLARFGTNAVVASVRVVPKAQVDAAAFPESKNEIDRQIFAKQELLRQRPAPRCDDSTFVRRVSLDILNLLPTIEESKAFIDDPSPQKREQLIERLLLRPEFNDVWALAWAEVLRAEPTRMRGKGVAGLFEWLRAGFATRRPFDQMVRDLVEARGSNFENPPANWYLIEDDPKALAENVAQVFLGVRIQCAQCHNHPFERWTMDDYYGFAAFFAQVQKKTGDDPRERIVFDSGRGEAVHPRRGTPARPKFLGGEELPTDDPRSRRRALSEWLTGDQQGFFASHVANRLFARFFGRGIVEPPDDVRVSNPPSHPALLDWLGRRLVELRYDCRALIAEICNSEAYQQATIEDGTQASTFAGRRLRRLSAEQAFDAIAEVTSTRNKFPGQPEGRRATEIESPDAGPAFLETFGRPKRMTPSVCERRSEPTLSQSLHLQNGSTIQDRLRDESGRLRSLLKRKAGTREILEEFWWAAYSRPARPGELEPLIATVETSENRALGLEDVIWALLNSKEFLFQH